MSECPHCGMIEVERFAPKEMESKTPQAVASTELLEVHNRFKHLDEILRAIAGSNDPLLRTCADLWLAIDGYVTHNAKADRPAKAGERGEL